VIFNPRIVVVPNPDPETVRAAVDVVAFPATVVVERKKSPPALRSVHCARPAPADKASCGAVDDERVIRYLGVDVPNPVQLFRKMLFEVVEVEIREPTVSCDDVAMIFVPSAEAVRIAFAPKVTLAVSVPDVVTGEFVIVNAAGRDSPTDVTVPDPLPVPTQIPATEKHPPERLIPFENVDDERLLVILILDASIPKLNVEVASSVR
jgi:hypothetical protein